MLLTSDPASGSDAAKATRLGLSDVPNNSLIKSVCCSGVPAIARADNGKKGYNRANPSPPSP